jgi:nicotinamidase-related amidase
MTKRVLALLVVLPLLATIGLAAEETAAKVKPALLVIDTQNAYLPYMSEQDKKYAFEVINAVIAQFRANGFPVIRVYHTDPGEGPAPGTEAFEFPKTIAILDGDAKVIKNYGNAFRKTDLDKVLKEKGANTLFLTGLSAVGCVLATYHGALDHDYNVFMVEESLLSHDAELTKSVQKMTRTINFSSLRLVLQMAKAQ